MVEPPATHSRARTERPPSASAAAADAGMRRRWAFPPARFLPGSLPSFRPKGACGLSPRREGGARRGRCQGGAVPPGRVLRRGAAAASLCASSSAPRAGRSPGRGPCLGAPASSEDVEFSLLLRAQTCNRYSFTAGVLKSLTSLEEKKKKKRRAPWV